MSKHQTIVTNTHPYGARIKFDADQFLMTVNDGSTTGYGDIGQRGMLELGRALVRIGSGPQEGEQ